jgi:ribosomal protein S18 acetylase RimI-like enzyme
MATRAIELVEPGDLVAMAQCMAIDADAFPYASSQFGARADSARVWVARGDPAGQGVRGGAVVAFLASRVWRGELRVEGIAVTADARRRGMGRGLVRAAIEGAREEGLRAVVLHVSVTNVGAVALYQAAGFGVARRLRDFYPSHVYRGERDAFEMRFELGA